MSADGAIRTPWREYITQVGALAELVIDYGWDPAQVALDPDDWEFDLGVYKSQGPSASLFIAGEVKKSVAEIRKTVQQILQCAAMSGIQSTSRSDGEKKFAALAKYRPNYFWAVAPGYRKAFAVEYAANVPSLKEVIDLPHSSGPANALSG